MSLHWSPALNSIYGAGKAAQRLSATHASLFLVQFLGKVRRILQKVRNSVRLLSMKRGVFVVVGLVSAVGIANAGFTVTPFQGSQWGASDASLGIAGYAIEDFEDLNLVNGLQVSVNSPNGNLATTSTLPSLFKPSDDSFGTAFTIGGGGVWDGQHGIINTRTNQTFSYSDSGSYGLLTFHFTNGASSAGFSIHQMDRDANILVNGASIGNVSAWAPAFLSTNGRNGYLRIDATGSDVINSVALRDVNGFGDGYMFDHVAFEAVPEPMTMAVLGLGMLCASRRRKSNA